MPALSQSALIKLAAAFNSGKSATVRVRETGWYFGWLFFCLIIMSQLEVSLLKLKVSASSS